MSNRGIEFINNWITENVNAEAYEPEGDNSRARELAKQCLTEAKAGISKKEIEEDMGDIVDVIAQALDAATNSEVARLVAKDD